MPEGRQSRSRFEVRVADTEQERQAIYRMRYEVYVEEMGKQFDHADGAEKILTDAFDNTATLLYVEVDGQLAATMRLNFGGETEIGEPYREIYALDRFARFGPSAFGFVSRLMVAAHWRSTPIMGCLVKEAYDIGRAKGARFGFCNCAPSLMQLYDHLGYRRYKDNFVDPDVGYRIPLVMLSEDVEHFRAIRSPLLRVARKWENSPDTAKWFAKEFPAHVGLINERLMSADDLWSFIATRLHDESVPLLRGLAEDESKRLLTAGTVLRARPGDPIVREGDVGNEMFVILSGAAEVRGRVGGQEHSLATLGRGEVFGEMAFLSQMARTADVVALTDLEVLVLSQAFLRKIMKTMPEIAMKVMFNLSLILCERLRSTTQSWVAALGASDDEVEEEKPL